jgi:hypothetical protein
MHRAGKPSKNPFIPSTGVFSYVRRKKRIFILPNSESRVRNRVVNIAETRRDFFLTSTIFLRCSNYLQMCINCKSNNSWILTSSRIIYVYLLRVK